MIEGPDTDGHGPHRGASRISSYTPGVTERGASDFRERARVEADRYGPDPWIFVRELLQNARDAGASRVRIEVDESGETTRLCCRDDGEGMSYAHARRYLFSLYASSKEARANQVGRFGVGFWSILRFEPTHITIRSRAGGEAGWEVTLDGELEQAHRATVDIDRGTQIVLERPRGDGSDARRVFEAAQQNARFLGLRDRPEQALPIFVNGRRVNAEFALPAPSSAFRRGRVRGVVGLGSAPRVELFSRGLRVRSAACLDDLLTSSGHTGHSRVRFPELPGGLAPQALLESDGLELLLSRSDARDTRTLRRLVKLGQTELRRLVERQRARIRPPGFGERVLGLLRSIAGQAIWWRALLGAATGAVLAVLVARLLWPDVGATLAAKLGGSGQTVIVAASSDRTRYGDLAKRYHGPQVSELDPSAAEPIALAYTPAQARPYFAALIIERVTEDSRPAARLDAPYPALESCSEDCLTMHLLVGGDAGDELRVPVPTGHRLVAGSLRYRGTQAARFPVQVADSEADEAVLVLAAATHGVLRYRTGPAPAVAAPPRRPDALPAELRREAEALRELEREQRVAGAIDLVRARVRYETSATVSADHQRALRAGKDFVTRTLEIGAGDCDVQNGLLVAVLHAADVDARLAVGWVGHDGRVAAWLHAWAEYLDDDGHWRVADATARAGGSGAVAGLPPASGEVAVGSELPIEVAAGVAGSADDGSAVAAAPPTAAEFAAPDPAAAAVPAPADATAPAGRGPRLPPAVLAVLERPAAPWVALGAGVLGLGLLGLSLGRRTAREFALDEGGDLSSLLRGALAQPAAFRHLPALFHRRLVPLRGGAAISLERARSLAARGRLYAGSEGSELSRAARRRGITLLDSDTPEGQTVAASLAAVDLERWGQRLERARLTPMLEGLSAYLREQHERWRLGALDGLGERVVTLDLRAVVGGLAARRGFGERLVLVDSDDPWLAEAERMRATRPCAAAFALLDHLLDHLEIGGDRRARLLAPLAARALAEEAARSGARAATRAATEVDA